MMGSIEYEYGEGTWVGVRTVMSLYRKGDVGLGSVKAAMEWDGGGESDIAWGLKWGLISEKDADELRS